MALPRLRVCQERSAVRQQWPGSSQDVLWAHERLSWMEPWQLLWRRVDICSSSSISRSGTTRSSRLRRSPILHACASCTLQSSTTDEPPPVKRRVPVRRSSPCSLDSTEGARRAACSLMRLPCELLEFPDPRVAQRDGLSRELALSLTLTRGHLIGLQPRESRCKQPDEA